VMYGVWLGTDYGFPDPPWYGVEFLWLAAGGAFCALAYLFGRGSDAATPPPTDLAPRGGGP